MKDEITSALNSISTDVDVKDGDYIGEDGLLHCGKCHGAKQIVTNIGSRRRAFPMLCECGTEERNKREEMFRQRQLEQQRERFRRDCFVSKEMYDYTFENEVVEDEKISTAMHNYVDKWDEIKKDNCGFLMYGSIGSGKTFYAACIANALIDRNIPALMTNFATISNDLNSMYEGKNEYIASVINYPLLIIDDLGAERSSDYMLEQVFNVVDARYQARKPLILTTNLPIEKIKNPENLRYKRIYDRILEMCLPIEFRGVSRRKNKVVSEYEKRKNLLGL